MTKPQDLFALAQAAIRAGYSPHTAIEQTSQLLAKLHIQRALGAARKAMLLATADEYQHLRNAKGRERRAQHKLLALAKSWEGTL
jgi:phage terminase small subunit